MTQCHFSADFGHFAHYHGSLYVLNVDNATVGKIWALLKDKCRCWNINQKDCKSIEVYYIENDKEIILNKKENENKKRKTGN